MQQPTSLERARLLKQLGLEPQLDAVPEAELGRGVERRPVNATSDPVPGRLDILELEYLLVHAFTPIP